MRTSAYVLVTLIQGKPADSVRGKKKKEEAHVLHKAAAALTPTLTFSESAREGGRGGSWGWNIKKKLEWCLISSLREWEREREGGKWLNQLKESEKRPQRAISCERYRSGGAAVFWGGFFHGLSLAARLKFLQSFTVTLKLWMKRVFKISLFLFFLLCLCSLTLHSSWIAPISNLKYHSSILATSNSKHFSIKMSRILFCSDETMKGLLLTAF